MDIRKRGPVVKLCESCAAEHIGNFGSGRFCSQKCAKRFSTTTKRVEINEKVSRKLTKTSWKIVCCACNTEFETRFKRQRVCSQRCRELHKKQKIERFNSLEQRAIRSAAAIKGLRSRGNRNPQSLLDLSSRTIGRIILRLGVGCSRCGWNEAKCDIHHIYGRKIPDPHNHSNLTYVCPNCHRLIHSKKVKTEEITTLLEQVGDRWKECYFG